MGGPPRLWQSIWDMVELGSLLCMCIVSVSLKVYLVDHDSETARWWLISASALFGLILLSQIALRVSMHILEQATSHPSSSSSSSSSRRRMRLVCFTISIFHLACIIIVCPVSVNASIRLLRSPLSSLTPFFFPLFFSALVFGLRCVRMILTSVKVLLEQPVSFHRRVPVLLSSKSAFRAVFFPFFSATFQDNHNENAQSSRASRGLLIASLLFQSSELLIWGVASHIGFTSIVSPSSILLTSTSTSQSSSHFILYVWLSALFVQCALCSVVVFFSEIPSVSSRHNWPHPESHIQAWNSISFVWFVLPTVTLLISLALSVATVALIVFVAMHFSIVIQNVAISASVCIGMMGCVLCTMQMQRRVWHMWRADAHLSLVLEREADLTSVIVVHSSHHEESSPHASHLQLRPIDGMYEEDEVFDVDPTVIDDDDDL